VDLLARAIMVGDLPTLVVSGEIDLATLPVLSDAAARLIGDHPGSTIAIDLDGVTVLDDAGLGILLGAAAKARELDGDVVLVCTAPRLRDRFHRSGLARAIEVRDRLSP
jgi:anti-sigma B factor antagonist